MLSRVARGVGNRLSRIRDEIRRNRARARMNRQLDRAEVDPRVSYPSYKSLDDFLDTERLKGLDEYLAERVRAKLRNREGEAFHTGIFKRGIWSKTRPGSLVISLTRSIRPFNYFDLDKPELWEPTDEAGNFAELMDFIATMPFERTARIMIICEDGGAGTTPHRDHGVPNVLHEFIWFRSNRNKPLFMLNHRTNERKYVESYSAWFDSVNQYHGSDPTKGLTFSMRVDGVFSDELRKHIPVPAVNPASTPSLWASESAKSSAVRA